LKSSRLPAILADFPIPTPPVTTNAPVEVDKALLIELTVTVPEAAPNEIALAAPKAFTVVAVVLNTAKVALSVATLVVNVGDVEKTSFPAVPVISEIIVDKALLVVITEAVPELYCSKPVALLLFNPVPPYCGAITVAFQDPLVIVELLKVTPVILAPIPPTYKLPPIPTPPETVNAPEIALVLTVELVIFAVPPINAFPANPRPPEMTTAPVPVEAESVLEENLDGDATNKLPPIPTPPTTTKAPEEVLTAGDDPWIVIAIPAENPVAERIPEAGLINIVATVESPSPVPLEDETKVG
jgi:hypothetical protein